MKSVSTALDETRSVTRARPVTSTGSVERLRLVDEHVGALREPRIRLARGEELGRLLLVGGPGVRMFRSRSTGLRKRDQAGSIPAPSAGSSPIEQ